MLRMYAHLCIYIYIYVCTYKSATSAQVPRVLPVSIRGCWSLTVAVALHGSWAAEAGDTEEDEPVSLEELQRRLKLRIATFPGTMFQAEAIVASDQPSTAVRERDCAGERATGSTMANRAPDLDQDEAAAAVDLALASSISHWLEEGSDRPAVLSRLRAMRDYLGRIACQIEAGMDPAILFARDRPPEAHLHAPTTPPPTGRARSRSPPPAVPRPRMAGTGQCGFCPWYAQSLLCQVISEVG